MCVVSLRTQACILLSLPHSILLVPEKHSISHEIFLLESFSERQGFQKDLLIHFYSKIVEQFHATRTDSIQSTDTYIYVYIYVKREGLLVAFDSYHEAEQHSAKNTCTTGFLFNVDCL